LFNVQITRLQLEALVVVIKQQTYIDVLRPHKGN